MRPYSVLGLRLHSNDFIPGLLASTDASPVDTRVWLQQDPPWPMGARAGDSRVRYVSPNDDEHGQPTLVVWERAGGSFFELVYAEGATFVVDRSGTQVWATWSEPLTLEDAAVFLLGPVLGFVLRLRGTVCLHASAVAVRAIALLGEAGAGKSTTAAAFAKMGYPVLSDNLVAVSEGGGGWLVESGCPGLRLWPDVVTALYGSADALPCLTPTWDKRYLDLEQNGYRFQRRPLPLGAIYILGDRRPGAAVVGPGPAHGGMMSLITNTYANHLLDRMMRAREFESLGRLVRRVPLRDAASHDDPVHVAEFCGRILDDFQTLTPSGADRARSGALGVPAELPRLVRGEAPTS